MIKSCIALSCLALIATLGSATAKTYKVSVTTELEHFSIDGYSGPLSDDEQYLISGPEDPVLENFRPGFVKAAFSDAGIAFFEEIIEHGDKAYRISGCKGVFTLHCQWTTVFYGEINALGFDVDYPSAGFFADLSSPRGTVSAATDDDYSWTNSVGQHSTYNGETLRHDLKTYEVEVVPLPGAMSLALGGFAIFGAFAHRRRKP